VTYWQVFAAMGATALAVFWIGWAACYLCFRPVITRHTPAHTRPARRPRPAAALPAALPELPAGAAAALDVRHANVMARTAPHDPPPLARTGAAVEALNRTLGMTAITAYVVDQWTGNDRPGARPWRDATGSYPAIMLELEHDPATAPGGPQ
jgi:hypothetical protein